MTCLTQILLVILGLIVIKNALVAVLFYGEIKEAQKKDPAAKSFLEVLFLYQGLHALVAYRVAHSFYKIKLFFWPVLFRRLPVGPPVLRYIPERKSARVYSLTMAWEWWSARPRLSGIMCYCTRG